MSSDVPPVPTPEQAEEAEFQRYFARVKACLSAIREKHGKAKGLAASMPCPNGCGGILSYSIAGNNGHVWGVCSTEGCAKWLQ